jgi:hypothetical protein
VNKQHLGGNELLDLFKELVGPNWHLFLSTWTDYFPELNSKDDDGRAVQVSLLFHRITIFGIRL